VEIIGMVGCKCAAFAMQVCDTPRMVTIKIDECVFKKPAKEGQLIKIYGEVKVLVIHH
jgi:acyl-CoA thioesterase YciA